MGTFLIYRLSASCYDAMHMKCLLFLTVFLGLVSCSGVHVNPKKDLAMTSILKNESRRRGLFDWEHFTVEMIDGKAVSYSLSWSATTKTIRLTEGSHEVTVRATFNRGLGSGGPYSGRAALNARIKPGRIYQLNGKVEGVRLRYWIEDKATGERACPDVIEPYGVLPMNTAYPIFIPVVQ